MFVPSSSNWYLVVAHLFVKVPQPGNSEEALSVFELSCHLLLPI